MVWDCGEKSCAKRERKNRAATSGKKINLPIRWIYLTDYIIRLWRQCAVLSKDEWSADSRLY